MQTLEMHLTLIAGTRPNFVKIAPIIHAIHDFNAAGDAQLNYTLVHTGQHYDEKMSDSFFKELNIPEPDVNLNVGSSSHSKQTAMIMMSFEEHLQNNDTDCVLVVGDVNSTMACAVVTKKLNLPLVHVEGGLRSGDKEMPEEINRLLTDSVTDYFYTTSHHANAHLKSEGIEEDRIKFVGNTMIDSLAKSLNNIREPKTENEIISGEYFLLTLHRPSNVDDESNLKELLTHISESCGDHRIFFPAHPRTAQKLLKLGQFPNIEVLPPLPYLEFLYMMKNAKAVITDSGGIQEETTYMQVPCLTLRMNTERPETIEIGTNILIGDDMALLQESIQKIINNDWKQGQVPELWDGRTSNRIVESIVQILSKA